MRFASHRRTVVLLLMACVFPIAFCTGLAAVIVGGGPAGYLLSIYIGLFGLLGTTSMLSWLILRWLRAHDRISDVDVEDASERNDDIH